MERRRVNHWRTIREESQKLFPEREFEKKGNVGGLEYGLLANNGKIYRVGTAASPGTDFYLPGYPIDTYVFIDDDGKPKVIKEFLVKIRWKYIINEQNIFTDNFSYPNIRL